MSLPKSMIAIAAMAALGACQANPGSSDDDAVPDPEASASSEPAETVSILRPEIEQPERPAVAEPLLVTIGFPDGGSELDEAAVAALKEVLASDQIGQGGPILLGGHSDTQGNDRVNLRAGRARAEAVRDWLVDNGIAESRIEVLTFGEQNPLEPNAKPDGSPNEAGRAANRRVEVLIAPPALPAD